jgi:DNA (cytosine-5)-methyltransferase 1
MNVIDLFAGAGGLSVGAHLAGGNVRACVELNAVACDTLRANAIFHGKVIEGSVCGVSGAELRNLAGLDAKDPLVIVGGPPCQPFSKAAYWTESGEDAAYRRARAQGIRAKRPPPPTKVKDDDRRDLVAEFMRLVIESDAQGFVFENVPSIKHPRNRSIYLALIERAAAAGFELTELIAKAVNYGVPQARERVVVLGSKKRKPSMPSETHAASDGIHGSLRPHVTAGEALEGLDSKKYFEPEEVISGRWAEHLKSIPPGWNYKALTEWAGHPNPTFVAETRFWNFLLKLSPDRPSWTIAASPGPWTGPFHWKNRRLRTVELAALQGFPRDYVIQGTRRERIRQMGNAVPVPVARAMVASVFESIA